MRSVAYEGQDPDPHAILAMVRRRSEPDNEVAATLGLDCLLVRTDDLAIAVGGFRIFSTGVGFTLRVLTRRVRQHDLADAFFGDRGRADGAFLLGVELADGRRATVSSPLPGSAENPDQLMLVRGGGSGGDRELTLDYFLSPVPPAGPLTIYALCEELGISQAAVTVDLTRLVEALPLVVELWPWEPDPPLPQAQEPPSFPPGSWFADPAGTDQT